MNIKALRAFYFVVLEGSLAAAANYINLSQPAVSRLISGLEHELRLQLFSRANKNLIPTEEGLSFFKDAERLLFGLNDIPVIAGEIREGRRDGIRLVAMPRVAADLVAPTISRFVKKYPNVRIRLDVQTRQDAERWIVSRVYDFGVGPLPVPHPEVLSEEILRKRTMVMMPKGHHLEKQKVVQPKDLLKTKIIALPPGYLLRQQTDDILRRANLDLQFEMEVASSALACQLVANGVGVTLVDALTANIAHKELYSLRPLSMKQWMPFGIISYKNAKPNQYVTTMLEMLRRQAKLWKDRSA